MTTAERTQKVTSASNNTTANNSKEAATTPQSSPETQDSASNNATANNSKETATTLQSAPKTQGSAGSGASGSPATGVASGSPASTSQAASQATPATKVTAPAASRSSAPANSDNATSLTANQAGTASANQTSNTSAAGAPASSDQTVTVDETTLPATQAAILSTNLARLTNFKVGTSQRYSAMLLTNLAMLPNSGADTTLLPTTQKYTKVEQPLLYDYMLHTSGTGTRDRETWVDKTVARGVWDYPSYTLDTIFGTTSKPGIITSNPDKYFFAAYVDYSEQYHRVILLARGQDPSDKNLYSYTIHTYSQNNSTTTKPGESIKEQYTGAGGSTHDLIFQNYGDSFSVKLIGRLKDGYGLLPVFDEGLLDPTYGSNTLDQNDAAAKAKSISFWASAMPQTTSTKVRYVDQATGKDIVQPMEISGFGYQGFKVKGDAPTVPGYHLVSKPEFLPSTNKASAYEDGTISPYKVGQTYDLALSDSVVIKQTVIDTNGTVRATAYYNGSRIPSMSASKVLGRESYNNYMSFYAPDGKSYAYTNRIGQVDGSYIYYYAKDTDPKGSDMRLHFIDVTGVNNSSYAPSDGPELDADKVQTIHGDIGTNYSFTYTVPKGYDQVAASDVTGTYSVTHHDAYVYVKIDRNGAKATIEKLTHLNNAQKQAAEAAIDQATDLNTMNQATSTATTLDGDMGKLSDLTADLTNTNNYKYASDTPKSTVATDCTEADVLLDKTAGQNADDATVLKLIDQINTHKSSLDGDTNLSAAETTISGLTNLNDAQRSAANQAVTNASDLTGLKTAVGNAQSVDSAMSDLQTAVNQANEAKTTNNYLQASADKKDNLNSAVQNAQAVLAATGANDSANQVKALTKSVNDAVNALDGDAINAINTALADKKGAINGTNLTAEEKTALVNKAQKLADDAIANINKATTNDAVKTAKDTGVEKINSINVPDTSANKDAAKKAIDQAAQTKDDAIDKSNLTAEEKADLKKQVSDAANEAKGNIDAATKDADVKTAQTNGEKAINAVEIPTSSKTKNDANSDLDNTADAAKKAIDETSGLTDDQKQTAKDQIDKAVDDAKENIKNASDNKGVADATDAGKLAIDKVSAKAAIDAAVAAKKSEIAQAPLTAEEAKPLNNLVDQDADAAKAAIDAATTSAAVETAKNNGVETINNIKVPTTSATKDDANKATDAGNITPTVPGGKVTVKDPSHLTDSEKDQVKKNVEDANKDKFPDGTKITVGDDGTTTVTYPDGSKDVIAGTDLVIAPKSEDVLGSKYHSHKNGSNSSQADRVKGASTANGSIANAGNNLGVKAESDNAFVGVKAESDNAFVGVKGESDNAIGNNKATSLKTLPQTGTKDTSILGVLGMLLASLGLFVFKKKRDKE